MSNFLVIGLGLIAQGLFSARFIVQLLQSEKENKVVSPSLFWQLSLLASLLLMVYGFFRSDLVIVGGQLAGYLIYIRNMQLKGDWTQLPLIARLMAFLLPGFIAVFLVFGIDYNWDNFLDNPEIEGLVLTWGTLGQLIFTSRFVVQWLYSEQRQESSFPVSFWYISLVGAVIIAVYAVFRKDAVLFIGQAFGLFVYSRNLMLHHASNLEKSMDLLQKYKPYRFPAFMMFTAVVLFFNLGNWEVTESSEARYALIPMEMVESGDYMHPTLMGIYHYHKPPMTYWITAAAYKIFGVSSWSARVFLQVALLLQLWLVYKIALKLLHNDKKAFLSAMLYASFPAFIIGGRALTTDAYLAVFILAAILFWVYYLEKSRILHLILFYLMLGLGFLTKGPVVLIVPVILLIIWKIQGLKGRLGLKWHLLGIVIFLSVGLSWFILLFIEDPQFLDYFVFKHTVQRFATNTFSRSQPFWFYAAIVLGTAFPWVLIVFSKFGSIWRRKKPVQLLLLGWMLIPLVFFSISKSKLILYILPVFPGISMLSILVWMEISKTAQKRWDWVLIVFQLVILVALGLSPLIEPQLTLSYKFYFMLVITASVLISIRVIPFKVVDRAVFGAYLFVMGITVASTYFFGANADLVNDQKPIAAFVNQELKEKKHLLIYDKRMPSMAFLTGKNIISLYDGDESLNRETQFERTDAWKNNLINLQNSPDWLERQDLSSTVLMIRKKQLEKNADKFLLGQYQQRQDFGKWVLLY
jgi:4-amino-4-deoxy-L-arabinose transferase-like glycosyltransferase/lipid-A-disaccharide synthase-like uncharacterized protein